MEDGTIADGFADVTVMFADIVNFTTLAEGMSPNQIFAMLNKVFSVVRLARREARPGEDQDHRRRLHGGGRHSTTTRRVNYSEAIAQMALDMRDLLAKDMSINDHRLEIRMGIGTGPVVAGRGRQEEVHLRPLGRHRQHREPDHRRGRSRHDPGRRHDLPPPAEPVRVRPAQDDLSEGQGRHDRLHAARAARPRPSTKPAA